MVNENLIGDLEQSMNAQQVELYKRIQAFSLDQLNAQLSFSQRLARDNNWSLEYAQLVIEEYKKFAFLAVVVDHPITPSDQVDQVWHLHLTYTRMYWEEFCSQVLQTQLHHDPTRGGQAENQKFEDWYSKTLESYEQFFQQTPPVEIWSTPEDRFGRDLHFVRVNVQDNWILKKFKIHKNAGSFLGIILAWILSSYYYATHATSKIEPVQAILVTGIAIGAQLGLFTFLRSASSSKNQTTSRVGSGWSSNGNTGCGGGWVGGNFFGHHSNGSGGDDGGGCGGGGCGGGGCGGCGG